MVGAIRDVGHPGWPRWRSPVDIPPWALKAELLDLSLVRLLAQVHEEVAVYASEGFTSYTSAELTSQLGGRVNEQGLLGAPPP